MDFLALAKRLLQEAGIAGTGPSTVVSQVGELKSVVDWVNDAWETLQNEKDDWLWMRTDWTYAMPALQQTLTAAQAGITAFGRWWGKTLRCYATSIGVSDEQRIPYLPWDEFRDTYLLGTRPTATRPSRFTIKPDQTIMVGPQNDVAYTFVGEYQKAATRMAVDADTPTGLPSDFHMVLVWDALVLYGTFEAAQESINRGLQFAKPYNFRLGRRQKPAIKFGSALA